jgi:hypothetical protein
VIKVMKDERTQGRWTGLLVRRLAEAKLDNVTSYSTKLRNPTQVATMTTALDLGVI